MHEIEKKEDKVLQPIYEKERRVMRVGPARFPKPDPDQMKWPNKKEIAVNLTWYNPAINLNHAQPIWCPVCREELDPMTRKVEMAGRPTLAWYCPSCKAFRGFMFTLRPDEKRTDIPAGVDAKDASKPGASPPEFVPRRVDEGI